MPFYYEFDKNNPDHQRTAYGLQCIREKMKKEVPERTVNETLLLATWNIREFDTGDKIRMKRTDESMCYIAEIISHFDLVAIQEVKDDLSGLDRLIKLLGRWWKYLLTDVTEGVAGNRERMAFLYDSRKVRFAGLSGEIVFPTEQLARTPFICGFEAGWVKFMMCTVHILWGESKAESDRRVEEVGKVAKLLKDRVDGKYAWSPNLVLLGDFNIFKPDNKTFREITKRGFIIPEQFKTMGTNIAQDRHYDQMAFYIKAYDETKVREGLKRFHAGVFNFFDAVYHEDHQDIYWKVMKKEEEKRLAQEREMEEKMKTASPAERRALKKEIKGPKYTSLPKSERQMTREYREWRTYQISDHFPMWIELTVEFGDDYLDLVGGSYRDQLPDELENKFPVIDPLADLANKLQ